MDNVYRRTQILEILLGGRAATQTELRRKLAARGIHVTQATVSRDIEELGLVKTRDALDAAAWPEVAGTVAGDDTIFVATAGARQAGAVRKKIMAHLAEL